MAQPRSPAITIAFKADSFMYLKTLAILARPLLQVLQPVGVGGDARVVHRYAFPADLLQLSAHKHGADGHLAYWGHTLPEKFLRSALIFDFRKHIRQFLLVGLVHPLDKALPAKNHGITWDKDKLPATFFKQAGGAALSPAGKGVQFFECQIITSRQRLHQPELIGQF